MPTPTQILAGLNTRFATVTQLNNILDYEPKTIQQPPALYSIFRDYDREERGNSVVDEQFDWLHRVCISMHDPEAAEETLHIILAAVPAAVAADPTLGGVITRSCYVQDPVVYRANAGFIKMGGPLYRIVDFRSSVMVRSDKNA